MELRDWIDTELAESIWKNKYCFEGESFEEWLDRVSNGNSDLRELIECKKFLFGGRILSNRGLQNRGRKITYSNCYVLEAPEDSIEGIFDTASKLARTFSYGGGVGIDLGRLRPKGAKVNNSAKATTGAVSFMDLFSMTTGLIGQNGRRGALMLSMPVTHPDIEEFIDVKKDLSKVTFANISVRLDDDFMKAVESGSTHTCAFYDEANNELISKEVDARAIFGKLVENNWDYAEPGILYWDNINNYNLLSEYIKEGKFEYASTNPCAEEPLPAGGSCLLGSINLSAHVDKSPNGEYVLDIPTLRDTVRKAVTALDEVLDEGLPLHPLQIQKDTVSNWRQIGLGIMGFADLCYKLGIPYGDEECIELIDTVGSVIKNEAIKQSAVLARELGKFPMYNEDLIMNSTFMRDVDTDIRNMVCSFGLRHSQLLTIAPTGSISTMLGISGGVEPIFSTHYTRRTLTLHEEETYYTVVTPIVEEMLGDYGASTLGTNEQVPLPYYMVTSHDIDPVDRCRVQGAWQKYIDASISSTVNLKHEATVEDVYNVYMEAWKCGCKGVTVYRDGCARQGILTVDKKEDTDNEPNEDVLPIGVEPRGTVHDHSDNSVGLIRRLQTGCGSLWVNVFFDRDTDEICDVFLSKGSKGGCNSFMVGLSRMISLSARAGVTPEVIIDQLRSVTPCPSFVSGKRAIPTISRGTCCPSAVANAMEDIVKEYNANYRATEYTKADEKEVPRQDIIEPSDAKVQSKTQVLDEPYTGGCSGGN